MNSTNHNAKGFKVLVTGGAGFLGQRIVEEFSSPGSLVPVTGITAFDIKKEVIFSDPKVTYVQGDVRDFSQVLEACRGVDVVVHSAAIIDWGTKSEEEVYSVNVTGTENVIRACKELGIRYLVYTGSLDAVFTGKPLVDIDESQPYPEKHQTVYCRSKYLAEQAVMSLDHGSVGWVVLRPSDIYGEADPYHIGSLIDMAKTGFYVRLGNGRSKCQHVYVGNMAHAHVLAVKALLETKSGVAGNVYFITDGPGTNFFSFFDPIVTGAGYRIFPKNLWLPRGIAYTIGSLSEFFAWLIRPIKRYYPKFSRFAVIYTCTDFTFSSAKAERELGYKPEYSHEEAVNRTIAYYRQQNEAR
jgi:nucleoside-diphosphate-sugar epimerase